MCPALVPRSVLTIPPPPKPKKLSSKGKEKERVARQVVEVSLPESEGEGTPAEEDLKLNLYKSDNEGEDKPMVSGPISPLAAQLDLVPSRSRGESGS